MDTLNWDLTIKQNPKQPNKYFDDAIKEEIKKPALEELHIKQLSLESKSPASVVNGEGKSSKDNHHQFPAESSKLKVTSITYSLLKLG